MRTSSLLLVAVAILSSSLSIAIAQTWVDVRVEGVLEDGVHVRAAVLSNDWDLDNDCFVRTSCKTTVATIQTPVGEYSYIPGGGPTSTPAFVIPYGETWEFTGYFEHSWGYAHATCVPDCVKRRDATPYTFDSVTREDAGHWEINFLSEIPDTVYATAKIVSDYWHYDPQLGQCVDFYYSMRVRPCLEGVWLGAEWIPSFTCSNGESIWVWQHRSEDLEFEIAFPRAQEYEIEGRVSIYYYDYWCEVRYASFIIALAPVTFNTETVPTREATWGQIKALYRR